MKRRLTKLTAAGLAALEMLRSFTMVRKYSGFLTNMGTSKAAESESVL